MGYRTAYLLRGYIDCGLTLFSHILHRILEPRRQPGLLQLRHPLPQLSHLFYGSVPFGGNLPLQIGDTCL
jgi:hypothetical protein